MRPLSSSRHLRLVVLNIAGLTVAGIVYAAIPDSNGVIHGCYANNGGRLRVIDTSVGGSCNASETALHWNQSGQKGPTGPTGPSDAYTLEGSRGVVPGDGATYMVASGSLPQGSFVVSTTVRIVLGGLSPPAAPSLPASPWWTASKSWTVSPKRPSTKPTRQLCRSLAERSSAPGSLAPSEMSSVHAP